MRRVEDPYPQRATLRMGIRGARDEDRKGGRNPAEILSIRLAPPTPQKAAGIQMIPRWTGKPIVEQKTA